MISNNPQLEGHNFDYCRARLEGEQSELLRTCGRMKWYLRHAYMSAISCLYLQKLSFRLNEIDLRRHTWAAMLFAAALQLLSQLCGWNTSLFVGLLAKLSISFTHGGTDSVIIRTEVYWCSTSLISQGPKSPSRSYTTHTRHRLCTNPPPLSVHDCLLLL